MHKGNSKSFKPYPERRAVAKHFWCGASYKIRKTNSYFRFNFRTSETHIKVRGVQQIYNQDKT